MSSIFISYSTHDEDKSLILYEKLNKNINNIFVDKISIEIGDKWVEKLYKTINKIDALVILLSDNWLNSKWCLAEYFYAKAIGKEIFYIKIDKDFSNKDFLDNHMQNCHLYNDTCIETLTDKIKKISLSNDYLFSETKSLSPYLGLKSYEIEDAYLFFGRENETKDIIEKLNSLYNKKILNIISASGMGKSSLLKAGVISRLKKIYKDRWIVLDSFRPKNNPIKEISKIIAKINKENFIEISSNLKNDNYKVLDIFIENLGKKKVLLPIDQVEELYTQSTSVERYTFLKILKYLLKSDTLFSIWTFRTDIFQRFQNDRKLKDIFKIIEDYTLKAISKSSIESIIKKPAHKFNILIEESLVDRIKEDLKSSDALPLLSLCLEKLLSKYNGNKNITLQNYLNLTENENPLESIIAAHADNAIIHFSNKEKSNLQDIFLEHLIRVEPDGSISKSSADYDQIEQKELLDKLINERILIRKENNIEIVHESIIRKWEFLQNSINKEKEFLLFKNKINQAVKIWKSHQHDSKTYLYGLDLENAIKWKSKFKDRSILKFIEISQNYLKNIEKEKIDLKKKQKHILGITQTKTATIFANKKELEKANLLAYNALLNLNYKLDENDIISEAKNIIYSNPPQYLNINSFIEREYIIKAIGTNSSLKKIITVLQSKTIEILDTETLKIDRTIDIEIDYKYIEHIIITPDNLKFCIIYNINFNKYKIVQYDLHNTKVLNKKITNNAIKTIDNSTFIFIQTEKDKIEIFDTDTFKSMNSIKGNLKQFIDIQYNEKNYIFIILEKYNFIIFPLDFNFETYEAYDLSELYEEEINIKNISSIKLYVSDYYATLLIDNKTYIIHHFEENGNINDLAYPPIALFGDIGTLKVYNVYTEELLQSIYLSQFHIINDNTIVGSNHKQIQIYKKQTPILQKILNIPSSCNISFTKTEKSIISAIDNGRKIGIWDITNNILINKFKHYTKTNDTKALNITPQQTVISSCGKFIFEYSSLIEYNKNQEHRIKKIYIYSVKNQDIIMQYSYSNKDNIFFLDNNILAVYIDYDKKLELIDIFTNRKILSIKSKNPISSICYLSTDKIAIGLINGYIKIIDINNSKVLKTFKAHSYLIRNILLSNDETKIITTSSDETVKVWDIKSSTEIYKLNKNPYHVTSIKNIDNNKIALSCSDGTIKIYDLNKGRLLQTLYDYIAFYKSSIIINKNSIISNKSVNIDKLDDKQYVSITDFEKLNDTNFIKSQISILEDSLNSKIKDINIIENS